MEVGESLGREKQEVEEEQKAEGEEQLDRISYRGQVEAEPL